MRKKPTLLLGIAVTFLALVPLAQATGKDDRPLPLGTLTPTPAADPGGPNPLVEEYLPFTVSCPGVQESARGVLGITSPEGQASGLVMFFSGGRGTGWPAGSPFAAGLFDRLNEAGVTAMQVRWIDSWMVSAPGESVGAARLGCRVATVVDWTHANLSERRASIQKEAGTPARPSLCGFCITGNSGGASQIGYALAHYGLDRILDAVVPTGALPHAGQYTSCRRFPGTFGYENWYTTVQIQTLDASYGYGEPTPPAQNPITAPPFGSGPCATNDMSFLSRWVADSIDTGGSDYFHPTTAVHFIFGELDTAPSGLPGVANAPWIEYAHRYIVRLRCEGSPYVTEEVVAGLPHGVLARQGGADALAATLLGPKPKRGPDTGRRGPHADCAPAIE